MTTMRTKAAIGGVLVGLALAVSTTGALLAQEPTTGPDTTPMAGDMGMMEAATPAADGAGMAEQMQRMMEQCIQMMQMMQMMMGMMGGNSGMMGGQGMEGMGGMEGMPAGTPSPGQ